LLTHIRRFSSTSCRRVFVLIPVRTFALSLFRAPLHKRAHSLIESGGFTAAGAPGRGGALRPGRQRGGGRTALPGAGGRHESGGGAGGRLLAGGRGRWRGQVDRRGGRGVPSRRQRRSRRCRPRQ